MFRLPRSNRAARISSGGAGIIVTATLLLTLAAGCNGAETAPDGTKLYSLSQLESDFDRYVRLIRRDHPMSFTDKTAFERTIAERRELLRDGMSEEEFYRVIAPVGAAVRCGHTRTHLSEKGRQRLEEHGRCLPLAIRLLSDALYAFKDFTPDETIPRGSRVLSINGHPAGKIVELMRASLHADGTNVTYKDYAINLDFSRLFTLLFGGEPRFELELLEPDTETPVTRTVDAMSPHQSDTVDRERYLRATDCERLCTTVSEDGSYAVLTIKDFGYYGDVPAFTEPVGEFFARLASGKIEALILDVRGNDGGEPHCSAFVARHLIDAPLRYFAKGTPAYADLVRLEPPPENVFTGELLVLTDGWCFSSTTHMLSLLRCRNRGVFIGEETGGSALCNDASKGHVMKHTRLELNLPRASFGTSARCLPHGRGIAPQIEIQATIEDLIAGRDVVMAKAVSLVSPSAE